MLSEDGKQLAILLDNGLSPNQGLRENSEKVLLQSASNNPGAMVELLLDILKGKPKSNFEEPTPLVISRKVPVCGYRRFLAAISPLYQSCTLRSPNLPERGSKRTYS